MPSAVIYTRISQDRAGAGLGVERQRDDCRELAERLGWDVLRVFTDNDVSAFSGRRRPAYEDMLSTLESGGVDGVLCWHTDRLHRSPRELERYIDLAERYGITTHSVRAGILDLSEPSGRMVARMLGATARYESEHKADRVKRAMHQAAKAGKFTGGLVPFGWELVDGEPRLVESEAAEVRRAAQSVLMGKSLGSVIQDMNARGIKTRTGRPFSYATLRQILLRPRTAGLASLYGEVVGPSQFPALLPRDEWEAVRHKLMNPARRKSQSNRVKHLLAGLARCGYCGARMKSASAGNRDGSKRTVYRCEKVGAGPGHPVRDAAPIEHLVTETVVRLLSRPDAAAALARGKGTDLGPLIAESVTLRQRLESAAGQFAEGNITGAQLATITARIQDKLAVNTAAVAAAHPSPAVADMLSGGDVRARWETATLETRRAVTDALMIVTIHPMGKRHGKVFDPSTVTIAPRDVEE